MNGIHAIDLNSEARPAKVATKETGLNLFRPVYRWTSWTGFWSNIGFFFRAIGQMFQRAKNGYCDWDIIDCGPNIIDRTINMLIEFRNTTNSWPDMEYNSYEDWIAEIDEIIGKLDFARQEPDEFNTCLEDFKMVLEIPYSERTEDDKAVVDAFFEENATICEIQQQSAESAFAWIGKHAKDLWS